MQKLPTFTAQQKTNDIELFWFIPAKYI